MYSNSFLHYFSIFSLMWNLVKSKFQTSYLDLKLFFGFFVSIWFRINWKMVSSVVVVIVVGLDVGFLRRFLGLLLVFFALKFDIFWELIISFFWDWNTSNEEVEDDDRDCGCFLDSPFPGFAIGLITFLKLYFLH